ncbi:MAG: restriction endonuclease subunit S [Sphingomonadales bacterium]|nr:restriction endonuclease subunit S [Sphingomonadales bacterium]
MSEIAALVSDHLEIWTAATERKNGAGRGGSKRMNLYGIERLRALILDLAVRGKLVPQDAKDEPATALLYQLKAERAKLMKAGLIGKGKSHPTVSQEPPFEIPAGWTWTQVSEIGHDWGQQEPVGDFTYIDVGSIDQRAGVVRAPNIVAAQDAPSRARKVVRKGTVIYSTVRPYLLNIAIVDQDFDPEPIASTAFAIVHPFTGVEAGFIYRYLRSTAFVRYVESCQTGIAYPAINDRQFFAAWCPLPPTAEQARIVAKVNELMALCDALEGESAVALAAHQALVETLLATLVNSADAADLAANWVRLETHFDTFFTTEASVDALKQAILDLAVRGKLVEQNNGDESAADLIKRLGEQLGDRRTGSSKGRQPKKIVASEALGFELPDGWAETTLGDVGETFIGLTYSPRDVSETGIPVLRSSNVQNGEIDLTDLVRVRSQIRQKLFVEIGDLLICVRNGSRSLVGKCALIEELSEPTTFGAFMAIYRSPLNRFVKLYIESQNFRRRLLGVETTTINQITQANLKATPIPLPPLPEQHRIVSKVEALMAICHELRAGITDAGEIQMRLADAVVERAAS